MMKRNENGTVSEMRLFTKKVEIMSDCNFKDACCCVCFKMKCGFIANRYFY